MKSVLGEAQGSSEDHWLSVSDLMAGLMMVFLFIAVSFMNHAAAQRDAIQKIAKSHTAAKQAIYDDLLREFENDLDRWNAQLNPDNLTFSFQSPDVLFNSNEHALKETFKTILDSFSPRYFSVLEKHKSVIMEVRIEGHTSPEYSGRGDFDAFYLNSYLSNQRAWSVFDYIYNLESVETHKPFIEENLVLVAASSTDLIKNQGRINTKRSRRVSLRVITNDGQQLRDIATR